MINLYYILFFYIFDALIAMGNFRVAARAAGLLSLCLSIVLSTIVYTLFKFLLSVNVSFSFIWIILFFIFHVINYFVFVNLEKHEQITQTFYLNNKIGLFAKTITYLIILTLLLIGIFFSITT